MSSIKLEQVDLIFKVWQEKRLKDLLVPGSRRFSDFKQDGTVHALNMLDLSINEGERLAVIGHNGAGKTTLLKLIAGIYAPTSGHITVDGRISSVFELSTGFEMESSGWDNIYLRGLMLGETPDGIRRKMREIAEFSELGEFLNMPVKYYSAGMFMRLAFSISTSIRPDILLLDEVIAAGDAAFLKKSTRRMREMVEQARIMVFVTHGMKSAVDTCNRCIWMDRGKIMMDGSPEDVTEAYIACMTNGETLP